MRVKFFILCYGYYGDIFVVMLVIDLDNFMYSLYKGFLFEYIFVNLLEGGFFDVWDECDIVDFCYKLIEYYY